MEFDLIKRIRAQAERRGEASDLVRGIGDDAAVISQLGGRDTVVTTDLLVEDIDFRRDLIPPRLLGHKALAVSLSDIASMGARPRWALLSIGIPQDISQGDFFDQFFEGFFVLADRYDVRLVGGDLSRTRDRIVIDSIVLGECRQKGEVFRSGAQPGDLLFVTGSLGGAAGGLRLLERGARFTKADRDEPDSDSIQKLLLRQLSPEPRVGWGVVLGEERLATAMIDVSDGLSSDANHLCRESNVGALIDAARIPIDPIVAELCGRRALDPLMLALHGGEDFELLFSVDPKAVARLPRKVDGIPSTCIGEVKNVSEGIRIAEGSRVWNLESGGWDHFPTRLEDGQR